MEEALHVMQTWQRFNIRTLTPYSWAADLSACAMSISPANVYKLSAIVNRNVRGRLGVSILPGSAKVGAAHGSVRGSVCAHVCVHSSC